MIKVYNVGQGDSFLFSPKNCCFEEDPILIDCGIKSEKVYLKIKENIDKVLISHSHGDHLNGLEDIIKNKSITNLYIPYFYSEIWSILRYLKLNKNKKANSLFANNLKSININLLKEYDQLCGHIKIYNPPNNPYIYYKDWLEDRNEVNIENALSNLNNLGLDLPVNDIVNYNSPLLLMNDVVIVSDISEQDVNLEMYRLNSRKFIHNFFISLSIRLVDQVEELIPSEIKQHFKELSNQVSIVFKYEDTAAPACLFTGDADISVFDRIMSQYPSGTLNSDILKVPHHGSKDNINDRIIKEISPSISIISHKNRYGHPHKEVIVLMKKYGINDYYTNDVIRKKKVKIRNKTLGYDKSGLIEFI